MRWILALLVLCLPFYARAEVCVFGAGTPYTCSAVGICDPDPTGCTVPTADPSADDFWHIGTGDNEVTTLTFGSPSGTFTLTFNGETTAPITYNAAGAFLSDGIRGGLDGLPSVAKTDVSIQCISGTSCTIEWIGAQACQNVAQPTCSITGGTCTPSTTTAGVAGSPASLSLTGPITQSGAAAGFRVHCDGTVATTAQIITTGALGLTIDQGSATTFTGRIIQPGTSPALRAPPHLASDKLEITGITNCPVGACGTPPNGDTRRIHFSQVGHVSAADPANPFLDETLATVSTTQDVLYWPPEGDSMDAGYWYEITGVSSTCTTAANCYVDIDARQSQTDGLGFTKTISEVGLATAVAVGDTVITVDNGTITADDLFIGWCVYIGAEPNGVPHVIKRTNATTDQITLLREAGSRVAAADTTDVFLSHSCHRAGDDVVIARPVWIRSATTTNSQADQEDSPVSISGNANWDWVSIEWSQGTVIIDALLGRLDHLWTLDRGYAGSNFSFFVENTYAAPAQGSWQVTGNPDTISGTYALTNQHHGIIWGGVAGLTHEGLYIRHPGDDCMVTRSNKGSASPTVLIGRCQFHPIPTESMQCLSTQVAVGQLPAPLESIRVGALECRDASGFPGDTSGPTGSDLFVGHNMTVDSAFAINMRHVLSSSNSSSSLQGRNLALYRAHSLDTGVNAFPFNGSALQMSTISNFLLSDWTKRSTSGVNDFGTVRECVNLYNGIILGDANGSNSDHIEHAAEAGSDYLLYMHNCTADLSAPITIDNVGWINYPITDGSAGGNISLVHFDAFGSHPPAGSVMRNLLFWWDTPGAEPDRGLYAAAAIASPQIYGLAVAGYGGATSDALVPIDAATAAATYRPSLCLADNSTDYGGLIDQDLPVGTFAGPRPKFRPHEYVAPKGSTWERLGCGLRGSPGVCVKQPWHNWEDIELRQTCFGAELEVSGGNKSGPRAAP